MTRGWMGDASGGDWGPDDGPDEGCGATDDEIIEALQDEVLDRDERIKWLRKNVGTMRRWIALHRCGDLSADAAFKQIEIDIDRIAGPTVPTSAEQSG
jgi:hypothetical protein